MPKTQKQLQSEQTRQHIIDTASRLFARKGYYGMSISDLAKATGLTKGALYHHFDSKEAIFFAVIKMVRETWDRTVARVVLLEARDALTRLTILIDSHARLTRVNPTLCLLVHSLMMEMDGVNPEFLTALQEIYTELTLFVEQIVQKGQSTGQMRSDLDARLVALNIVGMLRGGSCFQVSDRIEVDNEAVTATLKEMIVTALRP
jgi:TetR/AcrR family transcriptional repressor of nem operon